MLKCKIYSRNKDSGALYSSSSKEWRAPEFRFREVLCEVCYLRAMSSNVGTLHLIKSKVSTAVIVNPFEPFLRSLMEMLTRFSSKTFYLPKLQGYHYLLP